MYIESGVLCSYAVQCISGPLQSVIPSYRLQATSAGEPYDVDQLVVKYYCSQKSLQKKPQFTYLGVLLS